MQVYLYGHGLYITSGALFGSQDIKLLSDSGKLSSMKVVMKKNPSSLYPVENSKAFDLNEYAKRETKEVELYSGNVRGVASIFPRNVNTLCTAAIAAWSSVGMDGKPIKVCKKF